MANQSEEIARKIKDGTYFSDARDWYMREYVHPITERSFLIIVAIVLLASFIFSAMNLSNLNGEDVRIPFPMMTENATDYIPIIKPLAKKHEGTQEAVAKYFVIDYLKTREEYDPEEMHGKKLKYKMKKMKSSSSKKVLDEYQNYMSDLNPFSPLVRFQDKTTRRVDIKSFNFIGDDKSSGQVKVAFEALETTRRNGSEKEEINTSMWEATVHFRLPDIETIARTDAPLRFLVKYYRAKLLK